MKNELVKRLERQISEELHPIAFKKQGKTWRHDADECVCLLNLQKSQWGAQFYINLGVFVRRLEPQVANPKEHQCHLRVRLTDLVPDNAEFEQYLNFENEISEEQRIEEIMRSIRNYAVPWLKSVETVDGIRKAVVTGRRTDIISLRLKTMLGVE